MLYSTRLRVLDPFFSHFDFGSWHLFLKLQVECRSNFSSFTS